MAEERVSTKEVSKSKAASIESMEVEMTRFKYLPRPWRIILLVLGGFGVSLCVMQAFTFSIMGFVFFQTTFFYLLFACFAAGAFMVLPARKKDKKRLPWYDAAIFVVMLILFLYYAYNAWDIAMVGWVPATPPRIVLATITFLAILEASRRTGGISYMIVCLVLGFYPIYSGFMPGSFYAPPLNFSELVSFNIFGSTGIIGLPAQTIGELIIGYLIFAAVLLASGAGKFFIEASLALLGRFRGGPAKVAIVSSALFGTLSGSGVSNIMATGSVTIPTMKRMGFTGEFAAGVEACSSTGGVLMPPIMGSVAFVMAVFLGLPYYQVAIAAALPAILYYFGLMMQVDAYSAKHGLVGIPKEELPSLWNSIKKGWHFVIVLVFLVYALVYLQMGAKAPYYAAGILLVLSFFRKETRIDPKKALNMLVTTTVLIAQTMAIIIPIGMIVCGLTANGVAGSLTSIAVTMGHGNSLIILVIGFVVCYIMGMVGLVTPAYIFLAISLAPAVKLVTPDINVVGLHLFLVYYAILAAITPPVAAGAFIAATIANANPMKASLQSMRLGIVIYFIPFFFVYNPALILQGPWINSLIYFIFCLIGILFISGGIEGYLAFVGRVAIWERILIIIGGFMIALPEWTTSVIGASLVIITLGVKYLYKKMHTKIVGI
jgi:TRAP transporter 4TM/12TM fusion protein